MCDIVLLSIRFKTQWFHRDAQRSFVEEVVIIEVTQGVEFGIKSAIHQLRILTYLYNS